jgi:parallel beta-helix repeat protein
MIQNPSVMVVILLLLSCSFATSNALEQRVDIRIPSSLSKVIVVDDDGDGNYTTIQAAIDNATDGDTIIVFSGVYHESLVVNKQLILTGAEEENQGVPEINGEGHPYAVIIEANGCLFQGFTVNTSDLNPLLAGIKITSEGNTIRNNTLKYHCNGIYCLQSKNMTIRDNTFRNNSCAVFLNQSQNILVDNNDINSTYTYENFTGSTCSGIVINGSQGVIVSNNVIFVNFLGDGIVLIQSSHNTVTNNVVSSYYASNFSIFNLTVGNYGIIVECFSNDNEFSDNIITKYFAPMQIWESNGNKVIHNTFLESPMLSLYLYFSDDTQVMNNNFNNTARCVNRLMEEIASGFGVNNTSYRYRIVSWFLNQSASFANPPLYKNTWSHNYWNDYHGNGLRAKKIHGVWCIPILHRDDMTFYLNLFLPGINNFDWHPATQQYVSGKNEPWSFVPISCLFENLLDFSETSDTVLSVYSLNGRTTMNRCFLFPGIFSFDSLLHCN